MSDTEADAINLDSGAEDGDELTADGATTTPGGNAAASGDGADGATGDAGEGAGGDAAGDDGSASGEAGEGAGAGAGAGAAVAAADAGDGEDDEGGEEMMAELEKLESALDKMAEETDTILGEGTKEAAATLNQHGFNDAHSVYVGNVDYNTKPQELNDLFKSCGTVNRITIPVNRFKQAKGFAYVEFVDKAAVENALVLNGTELNGREIKVVQKRPSVRIMSPRGRGYRGRGRGGYRGRGRGYRGRGRGYRGRGRRGYRGRRYAPY